MKCDELFRKLEKEGWKQVRQKGSHKVLRKEGSSETIVFPITKVKKYQQVQPIES